MAAPANPARLFVGNLPWETEDAALQQLFSQCGTVVKCEIPKGRQGRSRGYGIVEFSAPHEAQLAVQQLHGAAGARIAGKSPGGCCSPAVCPAGRANAALARRRSDALLRAPRSPGHHVGDRDITVREDKAVPPKSAPVKAAGKASGAGASAPAAEGCRVYVGNLAWETTEEELMGARRATLRSACVRRAPRRRPPASNQPYAGGGCCFFPVAGAALPRMWPLADASTRLARPATPPNSALPERGAHRACGGCAPELRPQQGLGPGGLRHAR
jgi:hypothetical protein